MLKYYSYIIIEPCSSNKTYLRSIYYIQMYFNFYNTLCYCFLYKVHIQKTPSKTFIVHNYRYLAYSLYGYTNHTSTSSPVYCKMMVIFNGMKITVYMSVIYAIFFDRVNMHVSIQ